MKFNRVLISLIAALLLCAPAVKADTFEAGKGTFLLNGEPYLVKAAEIHYPRVPREYWEHRIQMVKSLGMNTVCIYIFWNLHEPVEGQFDFTGNNDIAEFVRLCGKNGLNVIVRPGPYVCAEWEMGGLPWWLLKRKNIRLREQDPYFMERVRIFEEEVGKQLAPLTVENGGPIIMVQVENEYGSYGTDKPYVSEIRDMLRDVWGDSVTLFQCDWSSNFENNGLDDLVWTMNFGTGSNIDNEFARLKELRPDAPLMCSEFWSGWFDKWGANHETRPAEDMVAGIDEMLSKGISFSLYMTHGGTSFGHWAGANSPGFAPDVTSYDYDAPITEWGTTTPKYDLLRETLAKYSDKRLPAVPKANPIIAVPEFTLTEYAPVEAGIVRTVNTQDIKNMEALDMGFGTVIYSTALPAHDSGGKLYVNEAHDYARVYLGGKYIGKIDRCRGDKSLEIPRWQKGDTLKIVVEAMGRINFGRAIKDFKGITDNVEIRSGKDGHEVTFNLKNWKTDLIPDDYSAALAAFTPSATSDAASLAAADGDNLPAGFYRGTFNLKKTGDTFLDMSTWGKGQVWVNGHALGRFWHIGPQQTLYCPGPWLKKGANEIIVFDVVGPKETKVGGLTAPLLDALRPDASNLHNKPENRPDLAAMTPIATGTFKPGNGWQTIEFPAATGQFVAIEALGTHDGRDKAAIAELYLLNTDRSRMSREQWTTYYADSEDDADGNHTGDKVFDLQESTYWTTEPGVKFPHLIVINLGQEQTVTGLEYLPRPKKGAPSSISDYRIYVY